MSTFVELCAYTAFVVAGWLVTPVLGLAVLGVVLLLLAHALEDVDDAKKAGAKGARVKLPRVRMPKVTLPKVAFRWPRQPESSQT